jgi:hypothetical protein
VRTKLGQQHLARGPEQDRALPNSSLRALYQLGLSHYVPQLITQEGLSVVDALFIWHSHRPGDATTCMTQLRSVCACVHELYAVSSAWNGDTMRKHHAPHDETWRRALAARVATELATPWLHAAASAALKKCLDSLGWIRNYENDKDQDMSDADCGQLLADLGYMQLVPVFQSLLLDLLRQQLTLMVQERFAGNFQLADALDTCKAYLHWPALLLHLPADCATDIQASLIHHLESTFFTLRLGELFDMVQEYPDSLPSWRELAGCMKRLNGQERVSTQFRAAIRHRLLHLGASTSTILRHYGSLIKGLEVLDPTGVMLAGVAADVRAYVSKRPDVRECAVRLLMGMDAEVNEQLLVGDVVDMAAGMVAEETEEGDEADEAWDTWEPVAVDSAIRSTDSRASAFSVVQGLVGLFDSPHVLAAAFESMLSGTLLGTPGFGANQALMYAEVLKGRLGEACMSKAQVMLWDVAESRRTVTLMRERGRERDDADSIPKCLEVLHLSHLYWPGEKVAGSSASATPHDDSTIQGYLPPSVRDDMLAYQRSYSALKPSRSLRWQPQEGVVELEVEFGPAAAGIRTFRVSPLEASLLCWMQMEAPDAGVSLASLSQHLRATPAQVVRALNVWQRAGLILEAQPHHYRLRPEEEVSAARAYVPRTIDEELDLAEAASAAASAPADGTASSGDGTTTDLTQAMRDFCLAVIGRQGAVPLDIIHRMIGMQVPGAVGKSKDDTKRVLQTLVQEERLRVVNGAYLIKRPPPSPS